MLYSIIVRVGPQSHNVKVVASCKTSAEEKAMRAFQGSVWKVKVVG